MGVMFRMSEEQLAEHKARLAGYAKTAHVVTRDSDGGTKVQAPVSQVDKRKPRPQSEESMLLTAQLAPLGFTQEYRFCAGRRWRFDQALVGLKIAVELEGAIWTNGRHVRPSGFLKDIEKYNRAVLNGWMVLRVVPDQVRSGDALETARLAIKARSMFHMKEGTSA